MKNNRKNRKSLKMYERGISKMLLKELSEMKPEDQKAFIDKFGIDLGHGKDYSVATTIQDGKIIEISFIPRHRSISQYNNRLLYGNEPEN